MEATVSYLLMLQKYISSKNKYLASIMYNSAIMCGEIIESYNEETKTTSTSFNKKKPLLFRQSNLKHVYVVF